MNALNRKMFSFIKHTVILSLIFVLTACSSYVSSGDLTQYLTGTWRVEIYHENSSAESGNKSQGTFLFTFVDKNHYFVKSEDPSGIAGYLQLYEIGTLKGGKNPKTGKLDSAEAGFVTFNNYDDETSDDTITISHFHGDSNQLEGYEDDEGSVYKYIFTKVSDETADNSSGDIFLIREKKKKESTPAPTSSAASGNKEKVTCTMCNGTGQVKYYYGDADWQYDYGICTSCDGKGYTMITPKGDNSSGNKVICGSCGRYVDEIISRQDASGTTRRWCRQCWREYDAIMN